MYSALLFWDTTTTPIRADQWRKQGGGTHAAVHSKTSALTRATITLLFKPRTTILALLNFCAFGISSSYIVPNLLRHIYRRNFVATSQTDHETFLWKINKQKHIFCAIFFEFWKMVSRHRNAQRIPAGIVTPVSERTCGHCKLLFSSEQGLKSHQKRKKNRGCYRSGKFITQKSHKIIGEALFTIKLMVQNFLHFTRFWQKLCLHSYIHTESDIWRDCDLTLFTFFHIIKTYDIWQGSNLCYLQMTTCSQYNMLSKENKQMSL